MQPATAGCFIFFFHLDRMPTVIRHSIFAAGIARWFRFADKRRLLIASILLAALPDLDTILMGIFGHDSIFRHRGIMHSFLFAALSASSATYLFWRKGWIQPADVWKLLALFFVFAVSHPLLDGFSTGGHIGVAFFAPFDNTRYVLGDLLPLAPLSPAALFTTRGANLFLAEAGMLWTFAVGSFLWNKEALDSRRAKVIAVCLWLLMCVMWIRAIAA